MKKKTGSIVAIEESEAEIKRPQRKRKGTPMRRNARPSTTAAIIEEDEDASVGIPGQIVMSEKLQEELSSPSKRPAPARRRTAPNPTPTERTKMLSRARQEFDVALQEALGTTSSNSSPESDHHRGEPNTDYVLSTGDLTVANEDFTMVSVETLESMKQNTSLLLDNSGVDKSVASVSYMPSSPPQPINAQEERDEEVQYPDISAQAEQAKSTNPTPARNVVEEDEGYDAMSWKPTGPLETAASAKATSSSQHLDREPSEWRRQREAVSQKIRAASASQVVVIEDDTQAGAEEEYDEEDDDIWAEEASRSIEEEQQPQPRAQQPPANTAEAINDLFSDQPDKPLRGKIPRTWRRTSGMDFSYVDSPEHGALRSTAAARPPDTDGEGGGSTGRSSVGVLTPPESSDEDEAEPTTKPTSIDSGAHTEDPDLTHPDAAATQLQGQQHLSSPISADHETSQEALSPSSDSSPDHASPEEDHEDTGMFWQKHLPNVYQRRERPRMLQRQKQRAMDLSDLLRSDGGSGSPASDQSSRSQSREAISGAKAASSGSPARTSAAPTDQPTGLRNCIDERLKSTLTNEKVVSSPLRKSLLKSSKIGGAMASVQTQPAGAVQHMRYSQSNRSNSATKVSESEQTIGESFESKASDQRQLLAEMNTTETDKELSSHVQDRKEKRDESEIAWDELSDYSQSYVSHTEAEELEDLEENKDEEQEDCDEEDQDDDHPTRSYEERLNLESPQKIKVKFDDSECTSNVLAPGKEYPPLFGTQPPVEAERKPKTPPSITLVSRKATAPASEAQPGIFSRLSQSFWSAVIRPSGPTLVSPIPEPEYSPSLRAQIRSRYGVLQDQHPWTMAHMRVLHRMLNSCTGKSDTIIPSTGPLPAALERLIGKELQCVTDFRWTFTEQHAHVVDAFMQLLVPSHYIEAMRRGEVDFLGDDLAKSIRGWHGSRHGDEIVFHDEMVPGLKLPKGTISRDFVVKALGNAVSANVEAAKRESRELEERRRIERERKAWERRMGVEESESESEIGEGSEEESYMLQKDTKV